MEITNEIVNIFLSHSPAERVTPNSTLQSRPATFECLANCPPCAHTHTHTLRVTGYWTAQLAENQGE